MIRPSKNANRVITFHQFEGLQVDCLNILTFQLALSFQVQS
jgi:hypothetical protein